MSVSPAPEAPRVAVVVSTYNRADRLRRLLDSLRRQELGAEGFEVVVVDDASTDETPRLLEEAAGRGDIRLRAIRLDAGAGPAVARDRGWRASEAPLIAFVDDDCEASPGWLGALVSAAADHGRFLQGRTEANPRERHLLGPFARTIEVTALTTTFNTCNIAYPRSLLERVDGFDVRAFGGRAAAGEDTDLAWRAIAAGAEPEFVPGALVYHKVADLGPVGALRMAARWTPAVRAYARHPELRRQRLVHGVFWKPTHLWLARALLALLLPRRRLSLAVAAWLALPYARSVRARMREGGRLSLLVYYPLHDAIELTAIVRGAVRERTPMI